MTQRPPRRQLRRAVVVLGILAGLAIFSVSLLRAYLSPSRCVNLIRDELSRLLQTPVTIQSAHLALTGRSTVNGLEVGDYLKVASVKADLSVTGAVMGARPRGLTLDEVTLHLRFDKDGRILTELPSENGDAPLSALQVNNLTLVLEQAGRPPFVVRGESLRVQADGTIAGIASTTGLGTWKVSGQVQTSPSRLLVTLAQEHTKIVSARLREIPFIPLSLWDTLGAQGDDVAVVVHLDLSATGVNYRVSFGDDKSAVGVVLYQPDRPHFFVGDNRAGSVSDGQPEPGIRGELVGDANGFTLSGRASDPRWGRWTVACQQTNSTGAIDVQLKSVEPVTVDYHMLHTLPYVPKVVWEQVRAKGRTSAEVAVRLWTHKPDVAYRVSLRPIDSDLHIAAIGLHAQGVSGEVIIENAVVKLNRVSGAVACGKIETSGTLDFRGPELLLTFAIRADHLRLKQLPAKWELPENIDGKISGEANIVVRVGKQVMTTGTGKGTVTEVMLGPLPIPTPIRLELFTEKNRLKFRSSKLLNLLPNQESQKGAAKANDPEDQPTSPTVLTAGTLATRATDGVLWLAHRLADGVRITTDGLTHLEKMTRPGVETAFLDVRLAMNEVDIATLAQQVQVALPDGISGTVSLNLTVRIPVNHAREPRAYRVEGTVLAPRLVLGSFALSDLRTSLRVADGLARFEALSARFDDFTFRGEGSAAFAPIGDVQIDIHAAGRSLFGLLPRELRRHIDGELCGRVMLSAPLNRADDFRQWRGTAGIRSRKLDAFNLPWREVAGEVKLVTGTLLLQHLRAELFGATVSAYGGLQLTGDYPYDMSASLRGLELARLALLLPPEAAQQGLTGVADGIGRFRGSLAKGITGAGQIRAAQVEVRRYKAIAVTGRWRVDEGRLWLDELSAQTHGGRLDANGELSFSGISLAMRLTGIDAAEIAARVPKAVIPLTGKIEAKAQMRFWWESLASVVCQRPDSRSETTTGVRGVSTPRLSLTNNNRGIDMPRSPSSETTTGALTSPARPSGEIELDLTGSRLLVAQIPVHDLKGRAVVHHGRIDYEGQGDLLGGRVWVEGRFPPPPIGSVGQPHGRIRMERVTLERLLPTLGIDTGSARLRGVIAANLPFRFDGEGNSIAALGRFEVRDLRNKDNELAESIRGDVRITRQGVFLRDVTGTFCEGSLRISGTYRLDDPSRGWFNIALQGAEFQQIARLQGETGDSFRGRADLHLRGRFGAEWFGTGQMRLTRGRAVGVDVGEWGLPVEFTYVPSRSAGEIAFRDSSAQVGNGRARVRGRLTFGSTLGIELTVLFNDASIAALAGLSGDVSGTIRGQLSGRIDITGSEVRSADDVSANIQLTLRETQALELPILRQVAPFLTLPSGRAPLFRSGEVRARLSRGVFRFEEFTLESAFAGLIIQGNATTAGRLDLDLIARTTALGNVNPVLFRLVLGRIPAVGPIPVSVIVQATELLANRVIHLRVGGTVKSPVVRVEPLGLLSQEAVRFLLTRLAP